MISQGVIIAYHAVPSILKLEQPSTSPLPPPAGMAPPQSVIPPVKQETPSIVAYPHPLVSINPPLPDDRSDRSGKPFQAIPDKDPLAVPLPLSHCPTTSITPLREPEPVKLQAQTPRALHSQTNLPSKTPVTASASIQWDNWPDGNFTRDMTSVEFQESLQCMVHWSHETSGSSRGSEYAETVSKGRKSFRRCNGIIRCDNPDCSRILRPCAKTAGRERQLACPCECKPGARLQHFTCQARWTITTMAHGRRHFEHRGHHSHPRLTHQLHLSGTEKAEFEALVLANPTAGPLELCVGVRSIKGTGKSAADIAPPFLNKDRIKVERNSIRKGPHGDLKTLDASLVEFNQFCSDEDFVRPDPTIGPVSVISMQTAAMRSELIKELPIEDDAVNGIITDAAHGFWQDRKQLLIVSSAYSSTLNMWMPIMISFSNGASAEHYHHHFLALFRSIRDRAKACNIDLTDALFRNVCPQHFYRIHVVL